MTSTDLFILISMILFTGGLMTSRQKTVTSDILFIATAVTLFPAVYAIVNEL